MNRNKKTVLLISWVLTTYLSALPVVDQISNGNAQISSDQSTMTVHPTNQAVIDYHTFQIGADQKVQFVMQDPSHSVLNRIQSSVPSQIHGSLESNGQVFLVNPAGFIFGKNAVIDTHSLFVAAVQMSNQQFLSQNFHFADIQGDITNEGVIRAQHLLMIAKNIFQKGKVEAKDGSIVYVVGDNVHISKQGEHLSVKAEIDTIDDSCFIESGSKEAYLLYHSGKSQAKQTKFIGLNEAKVELKNSSVVSNIENSDLSIQGDVVTIANTTLDVSSVHRGGKVYIGSDPRSKLKNTRYLSLDEHSTIRANATHLGNGGDVILWADRGTLFKGLIEANGGALGGDGGFVETSSGNGFHSVCAKVSTTAPKGKLGKWQIDPFSIQIHNGASKSITLAELASSDSNIYIVDPSVINAATSDVLLNATNTDGKGAGSTNIFLGTQANPVTIDITAPNVKLTISTNVPGDPVKGSFNPNGSITTTGDLFIDSRTVLQGPTSLKSGGAITFTDTIVSDTPSSFRSLTLDAVGDITFQSAVGANPIGDLLIKNAHNVFFLSQPNLAVAANVMQVRSFKQMSGSGDTNFEGPLITSGRPQNANPTSPLDGGDVAIKTSGDINFYYLANVNGQSKPILHPTSSDDVFIKSVITTTGGRALSDQPGNGFAAGDVTLDGNHVNVLAIYAGGTPAFPGSSGKGGRGGTVTITSQSGTTLSGPIFATGGAGNSGGGQVLPTYMPSNQDLTKAGGDSPGNITIKGPLLLAFNGIVLRGGNMQIGDISSKAKNLLAIDSSTYGEVNLGQLSNLSYFVVDYAKKVVVQGTVDSEGITLFNAGKDKITFKEPVVATSTLAIQNQFCVNFDKGLTTGTKELLNCCTSPLIPLNPPLLPLHFPLIPLHPPHNWHGHLKFSGVYFPPVLYWRYCYPYLLFYDYKIPFEYYSYEPQVIRKGK